jgi:hypothetical protein
VEKKMVNHFQRVEIRGKFNRKVPILLTKTMKKAIERILILRTTVAGVADSPYMFATPTGQRPFRGHDVLKTYALEAKVSNPAIFTFTQLRKQLATLAQAMAISELDQDQLADFLGHDIRIHRHIYRQPQEILQKAKVAKILMAINKNMSDFDTCIREELSDAEIDFDDEEVSETCNSALRKETDTTPASHQSRATKQRHDVHETGSKRYETELSKPCSTVPFSQERLAMKRYRGVEQTENSSDNENMRSGSLKRDKHTSEDSGKKMK